MKQYKEYMEIVESLALLGSDYVSFEQVEVEMMGYGSAFHGNPD